MLYAHRARQILTFIVVLLLLDRCLKKESGGHETFVAKSPAAVTPTAIDPADIGACATIDNTANDSTLECVAKSRSALPGDSPIKTAGHDSVKAAVDKLLACAAAPTDAMGIVGHGEPGFIGVGASRSDTIPNKRLTVRSRNEWLSDIRRLSCTNQQGCGLFTLLSCRTGSGPRGDTLLIALAKDVQRTVRARTGMVYCDSNTRVLTAEEGSDWKSALKDGTVQRSREPPRLGPFVVPSIIQFDGLTVPTSSIQGFDFSSMDSSVRLSFDSKDRAATLPLSAIDFGNRFTPPGEPLAVITGRITIRFKGEPGSATLIVYANRIARYENGKATFNLDSDFTDSLDSILDVEAR